MLRPFGGKSPTRLLLILGTCITFSVAVFCSQISGYEPSSDFMHCAELSEEQEYALKHCLLTLRTPEEMNKTRRIYDNPRCLLCKHTCRMQNEISNCVMTGLNAMQNVSTKSKHVVPLLKSMMETAMTSLCENDGQIMNVDDEEDAQCSLRAWNKCNSTFDFLDNLNRVAFCDSDDPSTDPYPDGYVCKEVVDFFDCAANETESCSEKVRSSLAHLKSKISTWESCTKYF